MFPDEGGSLYPVFGCRFGPMGLWAPSTKIRTVDQVNPPTTNRFYPLPDGRGLTWSNWPVHNPSGHVVMDRHTDGHLDGTPIPDEHLHELLDLHKIH